MIIATAGHVDHGKTSLLKQLTGVDADRLPEEKKRGLTIDLGFAYTDTLRPGETTGFVDVPGHEKFIHNMLAGVTAIDAALLVVAADDGPMPQTREHLAILDLVGVQTGLVAITKADAVDDGRIDDVTRDVRALLAPTGLQDAPILSVSSITGDGIGALRQTLAGIHTRPTDESGGFRMAIDRRFIVDGAGLVVTGLAQSGTLTVGDRLVVSPAGARGIEVRVRGIRVQDTPAEQARAGDRCALNLAGSGVDKASIGRGQWLVDPAVASASRRIDVQFRLLPSEDRPLRHWTPVHVHVGTADIPGRLALLESATLDPGSSGLAQLVLDRSVSVCHGDAVIVRDQSAQRTLGGGSVLDQSGPRRGRAQPARLSILKTERFPSPAECLAARLEVETTGLDLAAFQRNRNLGDTSINDLNLPGMTRIGAKDTPVALLDRHFTTILAGVKRALQEEAGNNPSRPGLPLNQIRLRLTGRPAAPVTEAAVEALMREGVVVRAGDRIALAGQQKKLDGPDADLWKQVEPALLIDGRPQTVWEVSESIGVAQSDVERFLKRAQKVGLVAQISKNRFATPASLAALAKTAESGLAALDGDRFTVANFRDWSGLGRNLSVEMLEYFDRAGFTRRAGNERVIRKPAADLFPDISP